MKLLCSFFVLCWSLLQPPAVLHLPVLGFTRAVEGDSCYAIMTAFSMRLRWSCKALGIAFLLLFGIRILLIFYYYLSCQILKVLRNQWLSVASHGR